MNQETQVLLAPEAEAYTQALETIDIDAIGGPRWTQQHEYIEKLNMQAVMSAAQQEDEFIKEFLTTYEKVPVLIHEVIATETWKQNVFPEFVKLQLEPKVMFPMYMVLYHEATLANLLETVLYHEEATSSADDTILDLIDYCQRKLSQLVAFSDNPEEDDDEEDLSVLQNASDISSLEELQSQNKKMNFDICVKVVSILRYIVDHLGQLPFSAISRILNNHDTPVLLVQLIENPPWTREKNGKLEKYVDNKWTVLPPSERFKLSKVEGQVWLAVYQLLMSEDCQRKYELSPHRKNSILKLRSYLTEVVLDQIPVLGGLQRYLEELSLMDPPPPKQELLLEQVPEIRDNMLKRYDGSWAKVAKKQSKTFFNPSKMDLQSQAKKWADMYNFDALESLITEPPKCALCGETAVKRCSRCQNEWYCRRECQVKHWKKHKPACNLLVDSLDKVKGREAVTVS